MKGKDIRNRCRKVKNPAVKLPPGYELFDEEDFVYLLCKDELVATFNGFLVDPAEIVKAANKHRN